MRKQWILCVALSAIGCAAFAGSGRSGADATQPFGYPVREARECATLCPGDRWPVSSSSGRRIEFMRRNRGRLDLMVMNANGRSQRLLAGGFGFVRHGLWSPNDRTLLLRCGQGPSKAGYTQNWLCTVDADGVSGQEPHALITPPALQSDFPLAWSPDGRRIAFRRAGNGGSWLFTARSDGSDLVSIGGGPDDSDDYVDAAWSRDGRSLAFITIVRTGDSSQQIRKLWVADAAGQGRRLVASALDFSSIVSWAPDGERIYLRSGGYPFSWSSVVAVDVATGEIETLVKRSVDTLGMASVSPDGKMLAFVQGRLITIMNADGGKAHGVARGVSRQVRWWSTETALTTFTWSADSKRLVYVSDGQCPTLLGLYSIDLKSRRTRRLTQACRIAGTARADSLVGTDGTDGIYGFRGDDRIRAGGRPDYVEGGPGDDLLDGGRSDDRLYGGPGHDRLYGGLGFDAIVANDGSKDRVRCGAGYDVVWADRGDDIARDCELVIRK